MKYYDDLISNLIILFLLSISNFLYNGLNVLDFGYKYLRKIFFHKPRKTFEVTLILCNSLACSGYMAPEYVLTGEYSEKSDVYSFGIMVLEIVSGQRNRRFHQSQENLLVHVSICIHSVENEIIFHFTHIKIIYRSYTIFFSKLCKAWRLWNEDRSFELIESTLYHSCSRNEVIRCIQIGMLCVQSDAARRPTTGAMVLMLTGSVALPLPSTPVMFGYDTDIDVTRVELSELYQTSTMSATSYTHI